MIAVLHVLAVIVIGTGRLPQALDGVAKAFVAIVDGTDEEIVLVVLKSLAPLLEGVVAIYTGFFIGVALGFLAHTLVRQWRRTTRRRARARRSQTFARAG
jgi:hypothetical protein